MYITLISETHNNNNFDVSYCLAKDGRWWLCRRSYLIESLILRRHSRLIFRIDTSTQVKQKSVRVNNIIGGFGDGTTNLDELKMIFTAAWDKLVSELISEASVTSTHQKDDKGNLLHQTLEQSACGLTLKDQTGPGGRLFSTGNWLKLWISWMHRARGWAVVSVSCRGGTITWKRGRRFCWLTKSSCTRTWIGFSLLYTPSHGAQDIFQAECLNKST